jgi:hypothetical protein
MNRLGSQQQIATKIQKEKCIEAQAVPGESLLVDRDVVDRSRPKFLTIGWV